MFTFVSRCGKYNDFVRLKALHNTPTWQPAPFCRHNKLAFKLCCNNNKNGVLTSKCLLPENSYMQSESALIFYLKAGIIGFYNNNQMCGNFFRVHFLMQIQIDNIVVVSLISDTFYSDTQQIKISWNPLIYITFRFVAHAKP